MIKGNFIEPRDMKKGVPHLLQMKHKTEDNLEIKKDEAKLVYEK